MATSKIRRKRSKTLTIMLLPALFLLFVLGWCIYWIGDGKKTNKVKHKPTVNSKSIDNVTILPFIYEEKQETINE